MSDTQMMGPLEAFVRDWYGGELSETDSELFTFMADADRSRAALEAERDQLQFVHQIAVTALEQAVAEKQALEAANTALIEALSHLRDAIERVGVWGEDTRVGASIAKSDAALKQAQQEIRQ